MNGRRCCVQVGRGRMRLVGRAGTGRALIFRLEGRLRQISAAAMPAVSATTPDVVVRHRPGRARNRLRLCVPAASLQFLYDKVQKRFD